MENPSSFKIYNASAGSGKTFNLVREYLIKIFSSHSKLAFRQILALTFTNKAVGEMKDRILYMLQEFSSENILVNPSDMFTMLKVDLGLSSEELHIKSKSVLKTILHNYAAFDVSTIDKFNHRLIRTFANDLKLPANFEVELDVDSVLTKAVDKLIDKAGIEPEITELLINFSLQKIDEDKSWDVSYDLNEIAKTLKNDDDKYYVDLIRNKTLKDFESLEKQLRSNVSNIETFLIEKANELLNRLNEEDLMQGVFNRNTLPNHFIKISKLDFNRLYDNQLESNLENNTKICLKAAEPDKISTVDTMLPEIYSLFKTLKSKVHKIHFLNNALRQLTPLSVLHEINLCLNEITAEEGLVLISDFNSIINNEIKAQPAPYIYERLGERYKDYFIDEFQDTSVLQWQNLIPLIDNAVSQETMTGKRGSAMLVGDAKQAIYRWRGGKPEQFINLYNKLVSPFSIEPEIINLGSNYRSKKTIVDFNNKFFEFISKSVFTQPLHFDLFNESSQKAYEKDDGYIEIQFFDEQKEELDDKFAEKTLQIVNDALVDDFKLNNICILTRTNKEGAKIATYLSEKGIPIISSETLLLKSSPRVNFVVSVLRSIKQPENTEAKLEILKFIYDSETELDDEHKFYLDYLHSNSLEFFDSLKNLGFNFSIANIGSVPLFELVEDIVRSFKLNGESDAYVQFLLDEVYQFSQKSNYGLNDFLNHWELKKNKLSVVNPEGVDAVRVMSIHKSKGLEFPVVIFPYTSQKIYDDRGSKIWFKVNAEEFSGFQHLYLNLNKEFKEFSSETELIYNNHRAHLELDSINLMYVALTRPMERLYVLCENDVPKKSSDSYSRFSELFTDFLKQENSYQEGKLTYEIGRKRKFEAKKKINTTLQTIDLLSTPRKKINLNILTKHGRLWDTERQQAIEKGNLMHHVLSLIEYKEDASHVFLDLVNSGEMEQEQLAILKKDVMDILNHDKLSDYFTQNWTVLNEREIIDKDNKLHRPDRILVNDKMEAVVIDYKSGAVEAKHRQQVDTYAYLLQEMNYKIIAKYVVYIGHEIEILEL